MTDFATVPDTNVIIAGYIGKQEGPNREFLIRWKENQFYILYSQDTVSEYIEKLKEKHITRGKVSDLRLSRRLEIFEPLKADCSLPPQRRPLLQ